MRENNKDKKYGLVDIPCAKLKDMQLDAKGYIKGLEEFIKNCPAPLSLALQGEWGTGKTSFLKIIQNDIETKDIVTVYFNTWQYSQFNMSDSLYISFIHGILQQVSEKSGRQSSKLSDIPKMLGKLAFSIGKHKLENISGINMDEISEKIMQNECGKAGLVEEFKRNFSDGIKEIIPENGKIVIFVDDLDRLNPEVAVELLEVIKLFMDVERCVFVLAVDYEVVVSGVRKKYGDSMTDEKCRSFFDKIIQVPFTMPVDQYNIHDMFIETFKESLEERYLEPACKLFSGTIGANPRTFKRFANSFFLLQTIWEEQDKCSKEDMKKDSCHKSLLLVSLVVQLYSPKLYKKLLSGEYDAGDLKEQPGTLPEDAEDGRKEEYVRENNIRARLTEALDEIQKLEGTGKNVYEEFYGILTLSSSTSTTTAAVGKTQAVSKITKICIDGNGYSVNNATEALVKTYNIILGKYQQNLPQDFMEQQKNILTHDGNENKSLFRASKKLGATYNGKEVFLGTSSGTPVKISQAKKLCILAGVPAGQVVWYSGDEVVFSNGAD